MSSTARRVHYTIEQYVTPEEQSSVRHEYLDGEIYAMAGGSPDHAALAAVVIRLLGTRLPRGCRVFTSDLRIRIVLAGALSVHGSFDRPSNSALEPSRPTVGAISRAARLSAGR